LKAVHTHTVTCRRGAQEPKIESCLPACTPSHRVTTSRSTSCHEKVSCTTSRSTSCHEKVSCTTSRSFGLPEFFARALRVTASRSQSCHKLGSERRSAHACLPACTSCHSFHVTCRRGAQEPKFESCKPACTSCHRLHFVSQLPCHMQARSARAEI